MDAEKCNAIIEEYLRGKTIRILAREYKTRDTTISNILKSNGIEIRRASREDSGKSRIRSLDKTYFKEIDCEEKSYWLGFLFADGYVVTGKGKDGGSKGGSLEVCLKEEDVYHVYNLLLELKSDAPVVKRYIDLKSTGKTYIAYRTCIASIDMVEDLIRHGCVQNKSLTLKPPPYVPLQYVSHFIRGYFDGDGCVSYYPDKSQRQFNASMIGTLEFLQWIQKILESQNIKTTIRQPKNRRYWTLHVHGIDNLANFYNYVYKDKTYYLERKKALFQDALDHYKCDVDWTQGEFFQKKILEGRSRTEFDKYWAEYFRPAYEEDSTLR